MVVVVRILFSCIKYILNKKRFGVKSHVLYLDASLPSSYSRVLRYITITTNLVESNGLSSFIKFYLKLFFLFFFFLPVVTLRRIKVCELAVDRGGPPLDQAVDPFWFLIRIICPLQGIPSLRPCPFRGL